jgi:citrate/tricarballylate utilization protein
MLTAHNTGDSVTPASGQTPSTSRRVIPIAPETPAETEVARQLQICNACRYCEGFCAVFPAMTRRLEFGKADVHFLANLCHNCSACLYACQYAPPHEFAVNIPQSMAQVRRQTYVDYAWPPALGALYQRNGLTLSIALAVGLFFFLALAIAMQGGLEQLWRRDLGGNFYKLFPHNLLVGIFAPVFLFVIFALSMGVRKFWRDLKPATSHVDTTLEAATEATGNVLTLKYLDGGHGDGCNNEDDAFTHLRRRFHHLTFYGFMLCLAATSLATVYHYALGWLAPYDLPSLPKLLGVLGGISLCIGTLGLWRLNIRRNPQQMDAQQQPMDRGFIALLFFVSASGLALWIGRATPTLALLLCLHLGAVIALFVTLPYGKFAHGIFRSASLVRHAVEKRQPNVISLGSDT